MNQKLRKVIEGEAAQLGFDAVGIAKPDQRPELPERLQHFLDAGYHGSMTWMRETEGRRSTPLSLWPEVKSIIMLGMNYGPEDDPLPLLQEKSRGVISVYARHRDYHDVIKGRLKTLASKIISQSKLLVSDNEEHQIKVFVDTAPVMEKPFAQSAGLGWQGKHTNLVSRQFGSWMFLGAIFTTVDLAADERETDHCGSCSNCLDICPTNAFPAPYQLDARRCISYLTIEHKDPIPMEFRKSMGNRIYGCDDCLAVCPWNKFAKVASEAKLSAPTEQPSHLLRDFLSLTDAQFRTRFSGSPVKRIGRNRFVRNCLIAAGNSNETDLLPLVMALCDDADEVVCDAARWAKTELEQ